VAPAEQQIPVVLASPHSGADYPADLIAASRLDPHALRRSEDSFVDEIFAAGPELGAPLLRALIARAYLDLNREPFELDPAMFEDPLPDFVNSRSPRVQVGLGTLPRIVASGEDIYSRKLRFSDALVRVDRLYKPYHRALRRLVEETRERFGYCLLVDCHSMPSSNGPPGKEPANGGGAGSRSIANGTKNSVAHRALPGFGLPGTGSAGMAMAGRRHVDFVLGDCHGTACHAVVADTAQRMLAAKGYTVARNAPYAGGFTTSHYGRPRDGAHCLQIEINRNLYMDERTMRRKPFLAQLAADMRDLVAALAGIEKRLLVAG
jgi:N-formylglutamate amidohydrolase